MLEKQGVLKALLAAVFTWLSHIACHGARGGAAVVLFSADLRDILMSKVVTFVHLCISAVVWDVAERSQLAAETETLFVRLV